MSRLAFVISLVLFAVSLAAPVAGAASVDDDTGPGPILVLGDSLSADYGFDQDQGWVALLRERLASRDKSREVINAAVSGDTTRSGRARLPNALEAHEPAIVILQLGGNDGLRGLPLDEVRDNFAAMIRASREAGARVLLVGVRMPPNYGRRYTEAFADMYHSLADEHDVALVPRILAGVAERESMMQDDRIHPTAEAQPVILDNVWNGLSPLLD